MGWYAAHAIMYVHFKDGNQDSYPVWENVYLVAADSHVEADEHATQLAKAEEGDSRGTFTWNDRPATWIFAGIRKTVIVSNEAAFPESGTEVTYTEWIVRDRRSLDLFVKSAPVELVLDDGFRDQDCGECDASSA